MRQVRRRRVLKQGERVPDLDGYAKQVCTRTTPTREWNEVTYTKSVVEPPSQLPMGVYFCRNNCDDDDELHSILKSSHTGPAQAVHVGMATIRSRVESADAWQKLKHYLRLSATADA